MIAHPVAEIENIVELGLIRRLDKLFLLAKQILESGIEDKFKIHFLIKWEEALNNAKDSTDLMNAKYRTAICYAYAVLDKSPIWSFEYWDGVGSPPKLEVIEALKNICDSSPDAYELLKNWIAEHLEKHTNQKHKGVCRMILKCLASIKESVEEAA